MPAAELHPDTELAGYRIQVLLARGGMGVVYQATQLSLERQVALKVVAPELTGDDEFRRRFLREALRRLWTQPPPRPPHECVSA